MVAYKPKNLISDFLILIEGLCLQISRVEKEGNQTISSENEIEKQHLWQSAKTVPKFGKPKVW